MIGFARVWPLCLLFLICCPRLGSGANGLERRRPVTRLSTPVAPPGGRPVKVIQSTVKILTQGRNLTTYVVYETQETADLKILTEDEKNSATKVLNTWSKRNDDFYGGRSGTLEKNDDFRLDLQNKFNRNGVEFANLQLQINNKPGQANPRPNSVAQVSIEIGDTKNRARGLEGMPRTRVVYYAATALDASLRQRRKTWVFQELTDAKGRLLPRNTQK